MFNDYKTSHFTTLKFEPPNWRNYCRDANDKNQVGLKIYDKNIQKTVRGGKYYRNEEVLDDNIIVIGDQFDTIMDEMPSVDKAVGADTCPF
jgi:hypothetical protein